MCSRKRQLEKTRSWKVLSSKVRHEIERLNLESSVYPFQLRLALTNLNRNFPTSDFQTSCFFQLQLSNFTYPLSYLNPIIFWPTSLGVSAWIFSPNIPDLIEYRNILVFGLTRTPLRVGKFETHVSKRR